MYKNVIFDLYGTLVSISTNEEKRTLWSTLAEFYSYNGCKYTPRELKAEYLSEVKRFQKDCTSEFPEIEIGEVFARLYAKKGADVSKQYIELTARLFRILSTKYINVYNGVPKLLDDLHGMGKNVYLLTNAQRLFTEPELKMLGLYEKFDGIVISSDVGCCKPDSNFFGYLLKKYNLDPSECVMVGNDADCDIAGAAAVGISSVYIRSELSPDKEPEYAKHILEVADINSLCKLV